MKSKMMFPVLNQTQKDILRYMDAKHIGCFFVDSLARWIWPCDIRENAEIAQKIVNEKFDVKKWIEQ